MRNLVNYARVAHLCWVWGGGEMGWWGDGVVGRWGGGEMGWWGDGVVGRWGGGVWGVSGFNGVSNQGAEYLA